MEGVFTLIEDLHPDLNPLMWLVGNWHGNGRVTPPGAEEYPIEQDVMFHHDGRAFLQYVSQSWVTDDAGERERPDAVESGFLLVGAEGELELVLSTFEGYGGALLGRVDGPRMEFATKWQARPETRPEYTEHRLYGLVESDLMYAIDREGPDRPQQSYAWGRLRRV